MINLVDITPAGKLWTYKTNNFTQLTTYIFPISNPIQTLSEQILNQFLAVKLSVSKQSKNGSMSLIRYPKKKEDKNEEKCRMKNDDWQTQANE